MIAGEKGIFDLESWLTSRIDDQPAVATVTVAEIWHGVERASATQARLRRRYMEAFLSAVVILPYTERAAYEHARIWAELESAGRMIGYYDLIVAATALERNSSVATFNKRDFSQVKGLSLIEPTLEGR